LENSPFGESKVTIPYSKPKKEIVVMKFGGASLASVDHFDQISLLIKQKVTLTKQIVIVVSAMLETTNHLISLAKKVHPSPPQREYDMLISVGERISISLLAMALAKQDISAISLTGSQSGIITCTTHSDARIIDVRPHRIIEAFSHGNIVIVAGFQGVSSSKEITTLGRGGSDTSAVALGIALNACCVEFYKDVGGIFSKDPKIHPDAIHYPLLTYDEALTVISEGAKVLHKRALFMAKLHAMPLKIVPFNPESPVKGTKIEEDGIPLKKQKIYEQEISTVAFPQFPCKKETVFSDIFPIHVHLSRKIFYFFRVHNC
jgi:aspartate kinase